MFINTNDKKIKFNGVLIPGISFNNKKYMQKNINNIENANFRKNFSVIQNGSAAIPQNTSGKKNITNNNIISDTFFTYLFISILPDILSQGIIIENSIFTKKKMHIYNFYKNNIVLRVANRKDKFSGFKDFFYFLFFIFSLTFDFLVGCKFLYFL